MNLSGWELTNALRGYLLGVAPGGDWKKVINDLQDFEDRRGLNRGLEGLSAGTQTMIAGEWIQENFAESMRWFTQTGERNYSNPENVNEVVSVLARLPAGERYQVVDWFEEQQGQAGWDDQLAMAYATVLIRSPLDGNAGRLAGLLTSEEDRFHFVGTIIGTTEPSDRVKLQHSPDSLQRLIESARLSGEKAAQLRSVIEVASWSPQVPK